VDIFLSSGQRLLQYLFVYLFIYLVFQGKIKQPKCKSCREFRAEFHLKGRTMFGYRALSGHVTGLTRSLKNSQQTKRKEKKADERVQLTYIQRFFLFSYRNYDRITERIRNR
jgi:hypothetical protein